MNNQSRLFDFLYYQNNSFPKDDMLNAKENGIWKSYSTKDVIEYSDQLSAALLNLNLGGKGNEVEKQDKIAIISNNRPEWIILDIACQKLGVILCPIYPTTNANEIQFIFNDASIKYVFVSGKEILEKLNSIKLNVPSLISIFSFDEKDSAVYWKSLLENISDIALKHASILASLIKAEDCATIIYTSGTTGTPKGVMLSHRNIVSNVLNGVKSFPFPEMPDAKALSFLPLNHIFERVASYIYIYRGISIYYAESMETIGENIKEVKPTIFTTVPRLLEKVYDRIMTKGAELKGIKRLLFYWAVALGERYDNIKRGGLLYKLQLGLANKIIFSKWRAALGDNVKFIITGGAACQVKLLRIFNAARVPIYEGYGPTENSPIITVNCQKKGGTKFGTVGVVIEGQEVKLESDGEICVKGPSVMIGYYKRPDLTNETIINGWLHTGDIGVFEDGKYLKITDRKKELFKTSGGKYVAPQAIENKFKESEWIEQIIVVGEGEKFVGALIVPCYPVLLKWLKEKNSLLVRKEEIINSQEVIQQYYEIINSYNQFFNPVEQIKKFELIENEWTIEGGELTPKLSMKRKIIHHKHAHLIQKIYSH
jgi:long-chain acyl-CoA synthetase